MRDFRKWLARKGSVGRTARWVADQYKWSKEHYGHFNNTQIYRLMLSHRYQGALLEGIMSGRSAITFNSSSSDPKIDRLSYLLSKIDSKKGLAALVITILEVEKAFGKRKASDKEELRKVIIEELEKFDLTYEEIHGGKAEVA
jgi:hypothetical protein